MTLKFAQSLLVITAIALAHPTSAADCQHSRWGADDQIGNANLITPASVLRASKLIKTGKTYRLGIVIDAKTRRDISFTSNRSGPCPGKLGQVE